jgi:hypothetical protein
VVRIDEQHDLIGWPAHVAPRQRPHNAVRVVVVRAHVHVQVVLIVRHLHLRAERRRGAFVRIILSELRDALRFAPERFTVATVDRRLADDALRRHRRGRGVTVRRHRLLCSRALRRLQHRDH